MQISLHARAAVRRQRSAELVHAAAHAAGVANIDPIAAATVGRHVVVCVMRRVSPRMAAAVSVVGTIVKCAANTVVVGINARHIIDVVIAITMIASTIHAGGIGSRQNM